MSGLVGLSPDMRSGLVGKFPSGHVLKTYYAEQTGSELAVTSSTFTVIPGLTLTVVPLSTTSKLLINFHSSGFVDSGTDTVFTWRIFKDAGDLTTGGFGSTDGQSSTSCYVSSGSGSNNNPAGSSSGSLLYDPNSTASAVYDIRAAVTFGSGNFNIPAPGSQMTIMEIES